MFKRLLLTFDEKYRRQVKLHELIVKRIREFQLDNYSEPIKQKIDRIRDVESKFYINIGDYNNEGCRL